MRVLVQNVVGDSFDIDDDAKYDIQWRYTLIQSENTRAPVVHTDCSISMQFADDAGEWTVISAGSVVQNPKDRHVKDKARKLSLAKALKNWDVSKATRINIWNSYFNRAGVVG